MVRHVGSRPDSCRAPCTCWSDHRKPMGKMKLRRTEGAVGLVWLTFLGRKTIHSPPSGSRRSPLERSGFAVDFELSARSPRQTSGSRPPDFPSTCPPAWFGPWRSSPPVRSQSVFGIPSDLDCRAVGVTSQNPEDDCAAAGLSVPDTLTTPILEGVLTTSHRTMLSSTYFKHSHRYSQNAPLRIFRRLSASPAWITFGTKKRALTTLGGSKTSTTLSKRVTSFGPTRMAEPEWQKVQHRAKHVGLHSAIIG